MQYRETACGPVFCGERSNMPKPSWKNGSRLPLSDESLAAAIFGTCGGCSWQNLDYRQQLTFKKKHVEELFERIGGLGKVAVQETIPAPAQYFYRNKMEFSFGAHRWLTREEIQSGAVLQKDFALGLHLPRRYDKILDLENCYLPHPIAVSILRRVRDLACQQRWKAYDGRKRSGFLRNLIIRTADCTGEIMVHLVTSRSETDRMRYFTDTLVRSFPGITTIVNTVNRGLGPLNADRQPTVYHGEGMIRERLDNLDLHVAPNAFFQPNTAQARAMYAIVRAYSELQGDEVIFDLYSGIGSISLYMARYARQVVGFENQESAVQNALRNARANRIDNCFFALVDAKEALTPVFLRRHGCPNLLITDPPRPGMHVDVCRRIAQVRPQRIIYVSCNPATQARDLKLLCESYSIEAVQPIDLFPQTHHIENIVKLRRQSK